jgi:hypothetical protein
MRCTETGDGKRARWRKAAGAVSASRVRKREPRTPRQRAADKLRQSEINYLRNAAGLPYTGALPRNKSQRAKLEAAGFIDPDGNITDHGRDALRRRDALDDKSDPTVSTGQPESFRFSGMDRAAEVAKEWAARDIDYEGRRRAKQKTPYDQELAEIAKRQGFDHRPQIGTREEVDKAVAAGWTEVWRGVQDSEHKTAADINGDMRDGHFQPGRGMYGNGVYTSTRRITAETYRGRDPYGSHPKQGYAPGCDFTEEDLEGVASPDSLLRIAIDPAARIVDYNDLVAEQKDWLRQNNDLVTDGVERNGAGVALGDPGRFAAARGYDAVRVVNRADGSFYPGWKESDDLDGLVPWFDQADQYVVLNRTIMMIQRVEDPP